MPRFVLLEHDHPELHWDLLLEADAVLLTWRLPAPPSDGETILATASPDHRKLYLDYEGSISHGRGSVLRWDHGTFVWLSQVPNQIAVRLEGERLRGILRLAQVEGDRWRGEWERG